MANDSYERACVAAARADIESEQAGSEPPPEIMALVMANIAQANALIHLCELMAEKLEKLT